MNLLGHCEACEAETERLRREGEHLRKSIANSDRDHWFEEAGRLADQLQGAVSHSERLERLISEAYSLLQQGRESEARAKLAAGYYATPRGQ
jgi:hypothetical protein